MVLQLARGAVDVLAVDDVAAGCVDLADQREPVLCEERGEERRVRAPRQSDRLDAVEALGFDPGEESIPLAGVCSLVDAPQRLSDLEGGHAARSRAVLALLCNRVTALGVVLAWHEPGI